MCCRPCSQNSANLAVSTLSGSDLKKAQKMIKPDLDSRLTHLEAIVAQLGDRPDHGVLDAPAADHSYGCCTAAGQPENDTLNFRFLEALQAIHSQALQYGQDQAASSQAPGFWSKLNVHAPVFEPAGKIDFVDTTAQDAFEVYYPIADANAYEEANLQPSCNDSLAKTCEVEYFGLSDCVDSSTQTEFPLGSICDDKPIASDTSSAAA